MIELKNASVYAGARCLLKPLNLKIDANQFVAIIGPNGAGKSTLLKALAGSEISSGQVDINSRCYSQYKQQDIALQRAVLPQADMLTAPLPVSEVIKLGLLPVSQSVSHIHQTHWVEKVAARIGLRDLLRQNYQTLSGGERARVRFARLALQIESCQALEQPADVNIKRFAFLDEPLAALDLRYQRVMMNAMSQLGSGRVGVVAVIHDLNWLVGHVDRVLVMHQGELVADASPEEVLANPRLSEWFETPLTVSKHNIAAEQNTSMRLSVYA